MKKAITTSWAMGVTVVALLTLIGGIFFWRSQIEPTLEGQKETLDSHLKLDSETDPDYPPAYSGSEESSEEATGRQRAQTFPGDQRGIRVSRLGEGYRKSGLMAFSSKEQPVINLEGVNISGEFTVELYEASVNDLLDFLTYRTENERREQKTQKVETGEMRKIASEPFEVKSGLERQMTLPLKEAGIWLLRVSRGSVAENTFLLRSDLAGLVKEGAQENILWTQNFQTHKKVPGVEAVGYNLKDSREELFRVSSDQEGIARLPQNAFADVVILEKGSERALIPLNLKNLDYSYSNSRFGPSPQDSQSFIFTDRPIYQPGDSVRFKAFVREDNDAVYSLPQGSATVKIYHWDRGGEEVIFEKSYPLSANGSLDGEFQLPADLSSDDFTVRLTKEGQGEQGSGFYGYYSGGSSTNFRVEHYQKPEYSVEVSTQQASVTDGEEFSFEIIGEYFSGHPLAGRTATYTITARNTYDPSYYSALQSQLDREEGYYDYYGYGYYASKEVKSGQVVLDQQGRSRVTLPAQLVDLRGSENQIFTIKATLEDQSARPAFGSANLLVREGEFGIYKKDRTYWAQVGQENAFEVVLVTSEEASSKVVQGTTLTAEIRRYWWERDASGRRSERQEKTYGKVETTTNQSGEAAFNFDFNEPGDYEIVVSGQDSQGNVVQKEFNLWVRNQAGAYYGFGSDQKDKSQVVIKAHRAEYQPGETAHFTISSTIPNRDVLVTWERGSVRDYQVVSLEGKVKEIAVPLESTDMPNIFVSANSFGFDKLDTSTEGVPVSPRGQKIKVEIVPGQEKYQPGETASIKVKTTDSNGQPIDAEVAVWAVDKAIFELADSKTRDIFKIFWHQRYNQTQEAHSLEGIFVEMAEGGGCFLAGTKVQMADETTKKIEEIKPGEKVLTFQNGQTKRLVEAKVVKTHQAEERGYLTINQQIKLTPRHVVWANNSWKLAGNLRVGDQLLSRQGQIVEVNSLRWNRKTVPVYNLEVEQQHSFFAEGVWVHNGKGGSGYMRDNFKDTAFWNPVVQTGVNGEAEISFQLPDDLTTWAVVGIGATPDTKVGEGNSQFQVTKDVIVRPMMPNILRGGDQMKLATRVQNFTSEPQTFQVKMDFDSGAVKNPEQQVTVASQGSEVVSWSVAPNDITKTSRVTFSAVARDNPENADAVSRELPLWEFGFWRKDSQAGSQPRSYEVGISPEANLTQSKIALTITPTLLGTLPEAMEYLAEYPYGCVEQTTSRLIPVLVAKENPGLFKGAIEDKDLDAMAKKGIKRLEELQNSDGSWGWWREGSGNHTITIYALESLLKAQELGFEVEEEALSRAKRYFENERGSRNSSNQANKEYLAKSIKEEGIVKAYAFTNFDSEQARDQKKITDFEGVSADVVALGVIANARNGYTGVEESGLNKLLAMAQKEGEGLYWESELSFGSRHSVTARALKAMLVVDSDNPAAAKAARYLSRTRQNRYWSNTFATAQVVQALTDYSKTTEELNPNYTYQVTLDSRVIWEGKMTDFRKVKTLALTLRDKEKHVLEVRKEGPGEIYSTLSIEEWVTDREASAKQNKELKITRKYVNQKDRECALGVGDIVLVRLAISGEAIKSNARYLVIEDQLPAGLVPVNPHLKNEQYGRGNARDYSWYNREVTENGIIIPINRLMEGGDVYEYKARVVSAGEFFAPPARAEFMYAPEVNAYTSAQLVKTVAAEETSEECQAIASPLSSAEQAGLKDKSSQGEGLEKTQLPWYAYPLIAIALVGVVWLIGTSSGRGPKGGSRGSRGGKKNQKSSSKSQVNSSNQKGKEKSIKEEEVNHSDYKGILDSPEEFHGHENKK